MSCVPGELTALRWEARPGEWQLCLTSIIYWPSRATHGPCVCWSMIRVPHRAASDKETLEGLLFQFMIFFTPEFVWEHWQGSMETARGTWCFKKGIPSPWHHQPPQALLSQHRWSLPYVWALITLWFGVFLSPTILCPRPSPWRQRPWGLHMTYMTHCYCGKARKSESRPRNRKSMNSESDQPVCELCLVVHRLCDLAGNYLSESALG